MNKKLSALSKPVTVDPVTVETVRERLSFLDDLNARGVGTAVRSQQFEISCLRELLAAEQHIAELEAKLAMPVRLPDGFKLMPIEITDEIAEAIAMEGRCCGGIALCIYEAALAAAPEGGNG